MEIIVEGSASEFFKPDKVELLLTFTKKENSYEEVLMNGVRNVESFINIILLNNGFTKEDMKTRSYSIREDKKYNELTRTYKFDGFLFNQNAHLEFDYDKERLAKLMDEISKLSEPPIYQIVFGIKNEKECKRKIIDRAFNDAKEEALAIANASGKTLKDCVKVDFKPFTTSYVSQTNFGYEMMAERSIGAAKMAGTPAAITNTFNPEDIEVTEKLYCLFLAE